MRFSTASYGDFLIVVFRRKKAILVKFSAHFSVVLTFFARVSYAVPNFCANKQCLKRVSAESPCGQSLWTFLFDQLRFLFI